MKKGNKGNKKIRSHQTSETLEFKENIGATGFEPATSRDAMELKPLDFKGFPKGKFKR